MFEDTFMRWGKMVKLDIEKITAHFGADFYEKLIIDLNKYTKMWELSQLEQIDYYSVNCIFKCISKKYGPCILKVGNSSDETKAEYNALREYAKKAFCKAYEADLENGVLLIEQMIPGTQLRSEPNLDKRLHIFCNLIKNLHIAPANKESYSTYMEWVSKITEYMRGRKDYEELYTKMRKAEEICRTLCEKYSGEMLLHGDLHHDNILLGENKSYRIIDPKGVVGDAVFDIPRFILNEFNNTLDNEFSNKYIYITHTLSKELHIPESDIRKLTYVEMCMGNCWCVESHQEPNIQDVLFTEKMMN